jgi:hypothetical protein
VNKEKLRPALLLIALAAVMPVMLGACSSGSSPSDPPSAQGGSTSTAQAGVAQFAQCMRQNGVTNFPDPQDGHFVMGGGIQNNPHFQPAIQACQHFLGPSGIGGNSQNTSAQLAFAHCMQTHGVPSFPDPQPDGAIVAPPESVRNTAAYQSAYNECKSKLPNGGAGLQG